MPAVMMRSCPNAPSAPTAIFTSNRKVMYSVTRIRKITSPVMAFREIVLPQVGPTSSSLISFAEMPARRASEARSWSPSSVGMPPPVCAALGEAAGDAGCVGVGVGPAEGVALAEAVAEGEALASDVAEGVAAGAEVLGLGVCRPSWVRLLVLI